MTCIMKAAIAVVCRVLHELFAEPKHSCYAEQDKKKTTCLQTKEQKKKRKWAQLIQPIFNTHTKRMRRTKVSTSFLLIYWATAEVLLTQKLQVKLLWSFIDLGQVHLLLDFVHRTITYGPTGSRPNLGRRLLTVTILWKIWVLLPCFCGSSLQ